MFNMWDKSPPSLFFHFFSLPLSSSTFSPSLPPSLSPSLPPSDKSPQLTEFVSQIKSTADSAQLFESIQADATATLPAGSLNRGEVEAMDMM